MVILYIFFFKKMEQRQAKLRQQNSLQLQNGPPPSTVPFNRSDSVSSVTSSYDSKLLQSPPFSSGKN